MYLSKVEKINYVQIVHIVCVRLQKTLLLGVTNHPFRISNPSERETVGCQIDILSFCTSHGSR